MYLREQLAYGDPKKHCLRGSKVQQYKSISLPADSRFFRVVPIASYSQDAPGLIFLANGENRQAFLFLLRMACHTEHKHQPPCERLVFVWHSHSSFQGK